MEWTKLTSVASANEADLLKGSLRQAGIDARTTRSPEAPGAWLTAVGNPSGPFDVFVPADEEDAARGLLPGRASPRDRLDHSKPRSIELVGRVLLGLSLIALIAMLLSETLR